MNKARETFYWADGTIYSHVMEVWEDMDIGNWTDPSAAGFVSAIEGMSQSDNCPPKLYYEEPIRVRVTLDIEAPIYHKLPGGGG